MVSFDCSENPSTCREFDAVSTFPAIRLYHRDGRIDRYRGPRSLTSIVPFLRRSFRPTVFEVTENSLVGFMTIDDLVIVAHVHPDDDHLYHRYRQLANHYRDRYSFGVAFTPPSSVSKEKRTSSVVRCYNNADDEQHELAGDALHANLGALEAFITQTCAAPLIPELTRRNEADFVAATTASGAHSILHYLTEGGDADKDAFREYVRPLAKKYKEYVRFAVTDLGAYPEMMAAFGLDPKALRGLALQNLVTGELFPYRSGAKKLTAVSASTIVESFLEDIADGNVRPLTGGDQRFQSGHDEL